jgi:hypothetical protein
MFNPVTESDYEDNVNRWAAAALSLAAEVIQRELKVDVLADVPAATPPPPPATVSTAQSPVVSTPAAAVKSSGGGGGGSSSSSTGAAQPLSPSGSDSSPVAGRDTRAPLPSRAATGTGMLASVSRWMAGVGMLGRIATVTVGLLASYAALRAGWMLIRSCMSG